MITEIQLNKLKEIFKNYTKRFLTGNKNNDANFILKIEHTHRVCNEIREISQSLNLSKNEQNLAETTALFHDIGRFEQYKKYKTFVDKKSENHALLGAEVIENEKFLQNLGVSKLTQELILKAVSYHNRKTLPENETEEVLFYTRILRDADKLDIFHLVANYYQSEEKNEAIELDLPDLPFISPKIHQAILNDGIANMTDMKTLNDFKLLQIGWIFDLNFPYSIQKTKQEKYINAIYKSLPKLKEVEEVFEKAMNYELK